MMSSMSCSLLVSDAREMRKIETQTVRFHQRSRLLHVRPQHLAQRRVQQMRRRVIAPRRVAEIRVDDGIDTIANFHGLPQDCAMGEDALHRLRAAAHIGDHGVVIVAHQPAGIADLAAGVGVEAGPVENNLDRVAGIGRRNTQAVFHNRKDFSSIDTELPIPLKRRLRQIAKRRTGGLLGAALPGSTGAGLLFGTGLLEAIEIKSNIGVSRGVHHEIQRQPIGFVQMECGAPRERGLLLSKLPPFGDQLFALSSVQQGRWQSGKLTFDFRVIHKFAPPDLFHRSEIGYELQASPLGGVGRLNQFSIELSGPNLQHPSKLPLFGLDDFGDAVGRFLQLGVGVLHLVTDGVNHLPHERLLLSQQSPMADSTPQNLPQHIATPLIRGQHAVRNKESRGPSMIRNDPQTRIRSYRRRTFDDLVC